MSKDYMIDGNVNMDDLINDTPQARFLGAVEGLLTLSRHHMTPRQQAIALAVILGRAVARCSDVDNALSTVLQSIKQEAQLYVTER